MGLDPTVDPEPISGGQKIPAGLGVRVCFKIKFLALKAGLEEHS